MTRVVDVASENGYRLLISKRPGAADTARGTATGGVILMHTHCSPQPRGHEAVEHVAARVASFLDNMRRGSLAADADLSEADVWKRVGHHATKTADCLGEREC
jgi:hypothetical protein